MVDHLGLRGSEWSATAGGHWCHHAVRAFVACLVVCIAAAQGDACPIVNEGSWPWVPYYVFRFRRITGARDGMTALARALKDHENALVTIASRKQTA